MFAIPVKDHFHIYSQRRGVVVWEDADYATVIFPRHPTSVIHYPPKVYKKDDLILVDDEDVALDIAVKIDLALGVQRRSCNAATEKCDAEIQAQRARVKPTKQAA